jgi:bifunctional non-homologous end joining protein LigD
VSKRRWLAVCRVLSSVGLETYRRKRDFQKSPEPRGGSRRKAGARRAVPLRFVVQKHAARRLHYDFRLELDGVLKSWAIPKGPSLSAGERRLAAQTEDHPLEYADFEGVIPAGEYGGGGVLVWDRGTWAPIGDPHAGLDKGDLSFRLAGEKLRGRWHLVRMRARARDRGRSSWLLIKGRDEEAREAGAQPIVEAAPRSVLTGRDMTSVQSASDRVWSSRSGERDAPSIAAPGDPTGVPGARKGALPRSLDAQLATLVDAAPAGDAWLHELKLDGYRVAGRVERGRARLLTRSGQDWTERFAPLAAALATLPAHKAWVDGEVVVLDARGRSDFQQLQRVLTGERGNLQLFLFDLLHLDGIDLRRARLEDRKRLLRERLLAASGGAVLHLSDHVRGSGPEVYAEACRNGAEGIVSKQADAPYQSGRSRSWLKVKCTRRQEFVLAGFTEPSGSRVGIGALLLAAHDAEGALRYAGKVGTGFDTATLRALRARLEPLRRRSAALEDPPRMRDARWVEPRLVAEVSFSEWTRDGRLRHPSFIALREDKPATEVRFERELPAPSSAVSDAPPPLRSEVAGVRLSTPHRIYFPDAGVTKSELAQYWEAAAERALPLLAHRPLSLVRCPESIDAECFYQKHANDSVPENVPRIVVKRGRAPYAMVDDLPSLISLVQIGVIELHVWGARADRLDRPDLVVLDLDPDPTLPWRSVVDTAQLLRGLLDELGLAPFLRTTGGKGLHVVAPLARRASWDEVKGFSHALARQLVRAAPDRYTATIAKSKRAGKILIDYLRNDPDSTAIASWSPRARAGAPVAVPLRWEELDAETRPVFSLREARTRLALPDPWAGFDDARRPLTRAMLRRVGAL